MKRDIDLYRDILLYVEKAHHPSKPGICFNADGRIDSYETTDVEPPTSLKDSDSTVLIRHCELLAQAGLIQISDPARTASGTVMMLCVNGITHEGHDFLDNVRDDTIWKKTKKETRSFALDVIKSVAEGIIKGSMGMG